MANICITNYVIEGHKEELDALYQTLKDLQENEISVEYPIGLGRLVESFGMNPDELTHCRGELVGLEYHDEILRMTIETAWTPCYEVINLMKTKDPSLHVFYKSEESGCELYLKNDIDGKYFPETEIDGIPFTIMTQEQEEELTRLFRGIKNGEITFQVHKQEDC